MLFIVPSVPPSQDNGAYRISVDNKTYFEVIVMNSQRTLMWWKYTILSANMELHQMNPWIA